MTAQFILAMALAQPVQTSTCAPVGALRDALQLQLEWRADAEACVQNVKMCEAELGAMRSLVDLPEDPGPAKGPSLTPWLVGGVAAVGGFVVGLVVGLSN
ncbi:MAG: hypothetical protein AAGJ19_13705 [Myxococcota bacterium]